MVSSHHHLILSGKGGSFKRLDEVKNHIHATNYRLPNAKAILALMSAALDTVVINYTRRVFKAVGLSLVGSPCRSQQRT